MEFALSEARPRSSWEVQTMGLEDTSTARSSAHLRVEVHADAEDADQEDVEADLAWHLLRAS